jgi:hypothetical protein
MDEDQSEADNTQNFVYKMYIRDILSSTVSYYCPWKFCALSPQKFHAQGELSTKISLFKYTGIRAKTLKEYKAFR